MLWRALVIIINEDDVRANLKMKDCINSIESCLIDQANNECISPLRTTVDLGIGRSRYNPQQTGFLRLLPGALKRAGYIGIKVYVDVSPDWSDRTVFYLYGAKRGEFLAIISADLLSDIRTGAVGGVAIKYLSKADSSTLGLFGTGRQARTQLEAAMNVRNIKHVKVISRDPEHAKKFVSEMETRFSTDFEACTNPLDVIGADIIITATTSSEPLFPGERAANGVHINAIGASFSSAREVDSNVVSRAKIVVNLKEQALKENGEFLIPLARKELSSIQIYGELCYIVAGKIRGRINDEEVTLFKFNGTAIWDIAAGALVYEKAKELGFGRVIDL
jgi:ornithine cyclodeaminase/alanine dehydrogenase-like protein (mu-crystallin family)